MPDLQSLRQHLRERFPAAHETRTAPPAFSRTGLPDFPRGALTEFTPATPASGLALILSRLLEEAEINNHQLVPPKPMGEGGSKTCPPKPRRRGIINHHSLPTALIDSTDSFDPESFGAAACARLLWVRCHNPTESLRCTDLLLRDGNLPLLVLDLQLTPLPELRRIPPTSWYRLRNLAEQSGATLLVFTPRHLLPCAALHLTNTNHFSLPDLHQEKATVEWVSSANTQLPNYPITQLPNYPITQ